MEDLVTAIAQSYSQQPDEVKRSWYSPVAENYLAARPGYPEAVVRAIVLATRLVRNSSIVEVGSGPGTATTSFARLGCKIDAIEPNPDFVRLAAEVLKDYKNVTLHNATFEGFRVPSDRFDVVLAASSFHWVRPEIAYSKAAKLLKRDGSLVLLWNQELQPQEEIHDRLRPIYAKYAPNVDKYRSVTEQVSIMKDLGSVVARSGHFQAPAVGFVRTETAYDSERYIALLSSYSPYLKLNTEIRKRLFRAIDAFIQAELGGEIPLSYISGYHIARVRRL